MKKKVATAMVLGMMGILSACSMDGQKTEVSSETAKQAEAESKETSQAGDTGSSNKTIAGIVFQEDQFFKLMSSGYEAAAKDYGYTIQLSNVTNDQMKETELVNTYTAQGVAGIAISPLSFTISPEALKASNEEGVKICIANANIDSYPFAEAAYTSDNFEFCKQTGEIAAEFIKEHYGDDTVKLGILQFKTQIPEISAQRVDGFLAALDEGEVKYEIVADQDAWLQDAAVAKTGDILAANPDIDILFAANDGGTIGSVMAVENAGLAGHTYVFGTDASEQLIELLKADNDILQAVTGQDSYQIGYKTVETLIQSIENKDVEDKGKTVIIKGILLKRGDTETLDAYLKDLQSKM